MSQTKFLFRWTVSFLLLILGVVLLVILATDYLRPRQLYCSEVADISGILTTIGVAIILGILSYIILPKDEAMKVLLCEKK
jgi:membrane protease YdiL (CAAX protease family)